MCVRIFTGGAPERCPMLHVDREEIVAAVRASGQPLEGPAGDWTALLERLDDARIVLLGEATHGTHEFYAARAALSLALAGRGFHAVVIEGDWPDAHRVHRYIRNLDGDATASEALEGFDRFPRWMWRNVDARDFIERLAERTESGRPSLGFYGMDLYSMHGSADAVVHFLRRVDPAAAELARERYACFEPFRADPSEYGRESAFRALETCEPQAVQTLVELMQERSRYLQGDGVEAEDEVFDAEQNARLVRNAEAYYRTMYRGGAASWNLRDTHMADTLDAILAHLDARFGKGRIIVWAHNSHLGDARATSMGRAGELNVGQLMRERHPGEVFSVGFTTWGGTVMAARAWDEPGERRKVVPGMEGSVEALFHQAGTPRFWLDLREGEAAGALREELLERAIGVVYRPESERWSHYFEVDLPKQFDAIVHFDETHAVRPLEELGKPMPPEYPETFPTGM